MEAAQEKLRRVSRAMTVIFRIAAAAAGVCAALCVGGIGVLVWGGEERKRSFLASYDVTANNGTVLHIAPRQLGLMFLFAAVETVLLTALFWLIARIFRGVAESLTPFTLQTARRVELAAGLLVVMGFAGGFSDAVTDYFTLGEFTWGVDLPVLLGGAVVFCLALAFRYGCELQRLSDETL